MSHDEKIAVTILPGMDGTGALLTEFATHLSQHRPVQIIKYPAEHKLGYDELFEFCMRRLPGGHTVVIGQSFSGPIAIEIAASGNNVFGLVLASSFAHYKLPTFLRPFIRLINMKVLPSFVVNKMLFGSTGTKRLRSRLMQVLELLPRNVLQARAYEVLKVDKRKRLLDVNCPIFCLHGRLDRLVSKGHVIEIIKTQPDSQVQWIDAAHMLLETHPEIAADAVNQFCEKLDC